MTAKEYLSEYRWATIEARSLLESIEELDNRLTSTATKQADPDAVQHSPSLRDIQADLIIKKVELEEKLIRKYKNIVETRGKIERTIETVKGGRERTLLRMRYIQGMRWEDICVAMGYEWAQTHRVHGAALKEVEEILKGGKNDEC